jgi:HAD superfamily hydrolase (TIGR01509 family)
MLVIFDCDGVLVDSEPIACATVADALAARGVQTSSREIAERYIGLSAASMYRDIETHFGLRLVVEDRRAIDDAVDRRLASGVEAMPGVATAIELLRARHALCVASSGTQKRIRGSLAHARLAAYFGDHLFSATQVMHGKPAPDLFLFAAAAMGAAPSGCIVIEDSPAGVAAARAAGMQCIGFVGGSHVQAGHADRLTEAGTAVVIERMDDLPAKVERIAAALV